ncbi:MAG: nucleotide exchange factor GrpE [Candidatus Omnitrophica bacterium]|nr:nucleotide exchange factor GrpE [Candidatus Omnitrophota bacterium]
MIENKSEEKQPVENEEMISPEIVDDVVGESGGKPVEETVEGTVVLNVSEHEKLLKELAESKEKYVRLVAEFDNARKRSDRERSEFVKYANEGLVTDFLTIMDDLDRVVIAANANHQDYQSFLKGVEMVMARIHELLRKNNVKPIEALGKPFDPHSHEILMQEPSDQEEGTVIEEMQKGYLLGDRVVRTAKVKVAVKKENE